MIVQAYLERQPESRYTVPCQVEKVVELSAQDFDSFVFNPLAAREFVAENKKLMRSEGIKNHCLLVLGRDRADGVLVNSEGTDQVRYAAYLPCARIIVNAAVEQAAERIVREGMENTSDGTWRIRFDELRKQTGLVVTQDNGLGEMLLDALRRRPEIAGMEVSGKHFGATYSRLSSARPPAQLVNKILDYLAEHNGSDELYQMLHGDLGFTNEEIDALGFDLAHRFEDEPDMAQAADREDSAATACPEEAVRAVREYLCFERDTAEIWPWFLSAEEMLGNEQKLREIGAALYPDPEHGYGTEEIHQALTEAFGVNPTLEQGQTMGL